MIVDLPNTTTGTVAKELVNLRDRGGVVALTRVLTLIVVTKPESVEKAVAAANFASREHPCRVVVIVEGSPTAETRLDGQIRVGGDAGASEVVILHTFGELAVADESLVAGLLLPDDPIVLWWPDEAPSNVHLTPLGKIAQRRITDAASEANPREALFRIGQCHVAGDTDLTWTRLTLWRAQLAAVMDQEDAGRITAATVTGAVDSPSNVLLAAWLTLKMDIPVTLASAPYGTGVQSVRLTGLDGDIVLARPAGEVAELYQPGRQMQRLSLPQRSLSECLAEELRRLDPDEVLAEVLRDGLPRTNLRAVRPSQR